MFFVYYLLDPTTEAILYVGRSNRPKTRKWAFEKKTGLTTCFGLMQRYSIFEEACLAELKAIRKHMPLHNKLVTSGAGSFGRTYQISEHHREAIRKANSKKPSPETVQKRKEALQGRVFSQEHKDALKKAWRPRNSMLGRKHSVETRLRMSATRVAYYQKKRSIP